MIRLACPHCGSTNLATIEQLTGTCDGTFTQGSDGIAIFEGDGYTEINWDDTFSIGWYCNDCEREDANDLSFVRLVPVEHEEDQP